MGYNKSGIDHINSCGALGMARLVPFSLISAINGYKTNTSNKLQKKDIRKILGITHRHKKVCDMGLIFNYFIQEGMHGRSPKETIDMILFEDDFLNKKIRQKLKIAKQLSESKEDIYQTIQEIGNSGFVEDVMYSSIYSALKGSSFEESILISANGGGDSDSRAAITGALCGLETGVSEIPNHLKKGLERSEDLEKKARLLYYLRK
jgi:ADP-ribosylglycohydrolase